MPLETILILLATLALWNMVVFCVYAWDKRAARQGARRVREQTLILLAVAGGGIGAFACQRWLRHKTRKGAFPILLPLMAVLQGGLVLLLGLFADTVPDALRGILEYSAIV